MFPSVWSFITSLHSALLNHIYYARLFYKAMQTQSILLYPLVMSSFSFELFYDQIYSINFMMFSYSALLLVWLSLISLSFLTRILPVTMGETELHFLLYWLLWFQAVWLWCGLSRRTRAGASQDSSFPSTIWLLKLTLAEVCWISSHSRIT